MILLVTATAQAATLAVPSDYATIQAAVDAADDGDIISVEPGDHGSEDKVTISNKTLEIRSTFGKDYTTLPRLATVGGDVTIDGFTLSCGAPDDLAGTAVSYGGVLTLEAVQAEHCSGSPLVGSSMATLTVRHAEFEDLSAEQGAFLFAFMAAVTVDDVLVEGAEALGGNAYCDGLGCGGAIFHSGGTLAIAESVFRGGEAELGGAIFAAVVEVSIESSSFQANGAASGSAIWMADSGSLSIADSSIHDGVSLTGEAAVLIEDTAQVILDRVELVDNSATAGTGGVVASGATQVHVRGSSFCGNDGTDAADIRFETTEVNQIDGTSFALAEGGSSVRLAQSRTALSNVTFAGIAGDALRMDDEAEASIENTVFVEIGGFAVDNLAQTDGYLAYVAYDEELELWGAEDWGFYNSAGLITGPLFRTWAPDIDCHEINLWLDPQSPLRDAGDPDVLDPDGSVSDIGAFGGPYANLADADGDAVYEDLDCDDADPQTFPDAVELPYDGIDQSCDGLDVTDVDGDGHDGLPAGGDDCDDENDDAYPGAMDAWYDGIDANCDGASDFDQDLDSYDREPEGDDCDDLDPAISPLAMELPGDGVDQDCNGADAIEPDTDPLESDPEVAPEVSEPSSCRTAPAPISLSLLLCVSAVGLTVGPRRRPASSSVRAS